MLKKKLSDILLTTKLVDQEQLNECMEEQQTSGKMLEQILLDRKIISKADLARALAEQINFPFLQAITESMTDINLLRKIPLKFLRQHVIIPIMFEARKTIVTADPRDLQPLDDLALLIGGEVRYAVAAQNVILDAINKYYPLETGKEMMKELSAEEGEIGISEEIEERDILEMANEAPIIKLVNHILYQAAKEGASDIHIEPFEKELRIRYRIDGNMYQRVIPPKRYQSAIVSRIKIMAHLNIAEKRIPQDGRISIKVADISCIVHVN